MTPQRARELRIYWMTQVSPGERSYDAMIEQAILAACKEERYAALTEAAEACIRDSSEEYFAERILAFRDQPKE